MAKRSRARAKKRAPPRRRTTRPPQAKPRTTNGNFSVILRTATREYRLPSGGSEGVSFPQAAMRWTYIVRSRQRWATVSDAVTRQEEAARDFLQRIGIGQPALAEIAQAGTVEVSIKWSGVEEDGWAQRILPWEYVIAGATRGLRKKEQSITVTRHLDHDDSAAPKSPIKRVLFVASEPGPLKGLYKFNTEREVVRHGLKSQAPDWSELDSPTVDQLRAKIVQFRPDIIHLAGFDTHLARSELLLQPDKHAAAHFEDELAGGKAGADEINDGYVLAGSEGLYPVRAEDLGLLLTPDNHRPRLVSLNFGNSAARSAPLIVAAGARAAIGFQDNYDDDLAEFFFSCLYSRIGSALDINHAFRTAWERVRIQPRQSQGTGIVLWNASPALAGGRPRTERGSEERQRQISKKLSDDEKQPLNAQDVEIGRAGESAAIDIEINEDLNYSLLHNQRPLFKKFVIHCRKSGILRDVRVKVSLATGQESAFYDRTLDISYPSVDLNADIHVPLTSSITRSIHESVRTSLFIEVTWGEHVLHRDTKRIRLTPVDQWRDSDTDRKWLPSFVFPRDPAISQLVDTAQRYVRVLRDNPAAGFDGYQSFDAKRPESVADIDCQVQAIWSAVVHELRLGYINPPPSYNRELDSQRLRTPSMVARDHSGTCIDLALFFAACLELVDIYPVIFLLEGHAFPGYWRASDYHDEFKEAQPERIHEIVRAGSQTTGIYGAQQETWYLGKPTYREIVQLVNTGKLVPIESVRLTENSGFAEAIDAGRDNLRIQREFEAMIDIALAREEQVTPLPILGEFI